MKIKLISVIIPAYMQEFSIYSDLKEIAKVMKKTKYSFEIICVVDGKEADNTFEEALKFAKGKKHIKVIGYSKNKGKGFAVRFGMKESKGDIVGFIDAGGDIKPTSIPILIDYMKKYNADIVVGSKRHKDSKVFYPWQRKILSLVYQKLIKIFFNLAINDTQAGVKLYHRKVINKVMPELNINRYAFDIEILSVAKSMGIKKIYEAPIEASLEFKGKSNITNHKFIITILEMILATFTVFFRLRILKSYSKS